MAKVKFSLATINALGATHTDTKRGNKFRKWAKSTRRTILLARMLAFRQFSVVGLQEFQRPQHKVLFKTKLGKSYGKHAIRDNAVIWKKKTWHKLDSGRLGIPYFGGNFRDMPWVILKHRKSGKKIAVLSTHNPANVKGPAGKWRREGWELEYQWVLDALVVADAVFVVGDKNAKFREYEPVIKRQGGKIAGRPSIWGIDWIVGWGNVKFSRFKTLQTIRMKRSTDHPVVRATCTI